MIKRLLLALAIFVAPVLAQTPVTVTGKIFDSGGNAATSGTVTFDIQPAASGIQYFVAGTGTIAPQEVVCGINSVGQVMSNSNLLNPCTVWGNDVITPANTTYQVTFAPNGSSSTNVVPGECLAGATYSLNSPIFCPIINVTPQQSIIRSSPWNTNAIPTANNVFTLGSPNAFWGSAYIQNLFVGNITLLVGNTNLPIPKLNSVYYATTMKCDGVTNDQPALQAVFASITAFPAQVVMPPGQCEIFNSVASVSIPDNVWLRGTGKLATTLHIPNGQNSTNPMLVLGGASKTNVILSDFTANGNATGQTSGNALLTNTAGQPSNIQIFNSRWINAFQNGILFTPVTVPTATLNDIDIHDNEFLNNAPTGTVGQEESCNSGDINILMPLRVKIQNNRSTGSGGNFSCTGGGGTAGSADVTITGNIVKGALGFGVALGTVISNSSITGNVFDQGTSRENIIDIGDGSFTTVTGNTVVSGNACAVACGGIGDGPPANHVTITSNVITGNATVNNVCMTLGSNDITIAGNACRGAGQAGLAIVIPNTLQVKGTTITGNTITNSGLAAAGHGGIEIFMQSGGTAAIDKLTITGNLVYDDQGTKTQAYGIALSANGQTTGYGTYLIANNDLRGNLTNGMLDNSTQTAGTGVVNNQHIIRDNPGYNPVNDFIVDLRTQNNNIGGTAIYTFPPNSVGMYIACVYEPLTTPAATSSTLPTVTLNWTDKISNASTLVQTYTAVAPTGNTTAVSAQGCTAFVPAANSTLFYATTGYASNAANAMQYALRIQLKAFN